MSHDHGVARRVLLPNPRERRAHALGELIQRLAAIERVIWILIAPEKLGVVVLRALELPAILLGETVEAGQRSGRADRLRGVAAPRRSAGLDRVDRDPLQGVAKK
jgi:hypothetical protein